MKRTKRIQGGRSRYTKKPYTPTPFVAPRRVLRAALPVPELKAIDTNIAYDINSTGTITLINGCARGDGLADRIGRKTFMKSVQMRLYAAPTASTGLEQMGRVLVVYDKQANASATTIADVLTSASVFAFPNLSGALRYQIIMDQVFPLTDNTGTSGLPHVMNEFRSLKLPVHYNAGDAGTIADITTGALYVITLGNLSAGTTDATANISTRVRYTDA